jgi:hypothetical protein
MTAEVQFYPIAILTDMLVQYACEGTNGWIAPDSSRRAFRAKLWSLVNLSAIGLGVIDPKMSAAIIDETETLQASSLYSIRNFI